MGIQEVYKEDTFRILPGSRRFALINSFLSIPCTLVVFFAGIAVHGALCVTVFIPSLQGAQRFRKVRKTSCFLCGHCGSWRSLRYCIHTAIAGCAKFSQGAQDLFLWRQVFSEDVVEENQGDSLEKK
jgi:hypothetical protein